MLTYLWKKKLFVSKGTPIETWNEADTLTLINCPYEEILITYDWYLILFAIIIIILMFIILKRRKASITKLLLLISLPINIIDMNIIEYDEYCNYLDDKLNKIRNKELPPLPDNIKYPVKKYI